ncbi:MAG TPA: hypothetical protein VK927_01630, partial [Adhaeribacter sp.]|nr:hypothetical protein [Adhaeribacter sp.]
MRADNNWEDPVRKKLFEFEGPLTEQNWENISKQIQPKSKPWRRWLWLPALLVFIAIPVTFYFGAKDRKSSETAEKTAFQKPV